MTQEIKERIAEMQGRMAAVDDNIETVTFKVSDLSKTVTKNHDETNQRLNEHTQHTDLLQGQLQSMETKLNDLNTSNKVLLKMLGKMMGVE
jgi:uncharacterized coiled-coil protein SlyX